MFLQMTNISDKLESALFLMKWQTAFIKKGKLWE